MGYKNVRFVNWDGWIGSLYLAPGRSPRYFWDEGPQWKGRDPVGHVRQGGVRVRHRVISQGDYAAALASCRVPASVIC